ncbi:MAG: hypothetical protein GY757_52495 [bacterium]|nr:hypothetical protein [bacterium]
MTVRKASVELGKQNLLPGKHCLALGKGELLTHLIIYKLRIAGGELCYLQKNLEG